MYSLFPALRTVSATFNFKPEHLATVWSRRAVSPRDCSAAFTGLCRVLPAMSLLSYVIRFPGQVGLTGRKTGENNCMDEQKHKLLICKSLVCLVHRGASVPDIARNDRGFAAVCPICLKVRRQEPFPPPDLPPRLERLVEPCRSKATLRPLPVRTQWISADLKMETT